MHISDEDYQRLLSKINFGASDDSCWIWTGSQVRGYGMFWLNGKSLRVGRLLYRLIIGPIDDDLCVCHSCDNPSCCNVNHFFLATSEENTEDKMRKQRHRFLSGENHGCSRLSDADVVAIRQSYTSGLTQRDLAAQYQVTRQHISALIARRRR